MRGGLLRKGLYGGIGGESIYSVLFVWMMEKCIFVKKKRRIAYGCDVKFEL